MAEMILPGTFIEVRAEGLITPGRVSVNNVAVVGTARKGPVDRVTFLSSYTEARQIFGEYDAWPEDPTPANTQNLLTLSRALEQAFRFGATTVLAVRIHDGNAAAAGMTLGSAGGDNVTLAAQSAGEWGNDIQVNVTDADTHSFVDEEEHSGGGAISLDYAPVVASARNRASVFVDAEQRTRSLNITDSTPPGPGQVHIDSASGDLTFPAGEEPAASDTVTVSYVVDQSASAKVTVRHGLQEEVYIVANGGDLANDINNNSAMVTAEAAANAAELPDSFNDAFDFRGFTGGSNGEDVDASDYLAGMDLLTNEPAHIITAAGQSHKAIGADLAAHVGVASSDVNKHERMGIVGSAVDDEFDDIRGHNLNSDRIVFVAPGIRATDAASGRVVELPGAYTAAAVAGLLASYSPHISLTNKPLPVADLSVYYTAAQLTQLVQNRVLAVQRKQGFKVVKGITTSTNTAWRQITTRRIVDYAKYGVRSAADPYIGLLNNERVRAALRATINSFLAEMVEDEMLISYDLDVTATRAEERQGIVRVTTVLRPVFSIDFIKVTMFLE